MRRHNTVTNTYVHVDDVKQLPGVNYCEWIKITKCQLISREKALLNTRIETIESKINNELELFYDSKGIKDINKKIKYTISQNICKNLYDTIAYMINQWQGVVLTKRKRVKPYNTFREYFLVGKNWWDQTKTNVYGLNLWVQVFKDIQKFASSMLSQNECLFYKILVCLFNAEVKYVNTKEQPLITNGVIKKCKELKSFLFNLNHSLDIDSWLKRDIISQKEADQENNNKKKKRTGNAKAIAEKLRTHLIHLAQSTDTSTHTRHQQIRVGQPTETEHKQNLTSTHNNTANNINLGYDQLIFNLADAFIGTNNSNNDNNNNNNQINNISNYNMNNQQQSNNSTIIIIPILQPPIIPQTQTYSNIIPQQGIYNGSSVTRSRLNATSHQRYNPLDGTMHSSNSTQMQLYKQ